MYKNNHIAVVLPAYNEALSIHKVISSLVVLKNAQGGALIDELIVCDNNSDDQTPILAKQAGAHVVNEHQQGYGAACLTALNALKKADIVIFVDADGSVNTQEIVNLLNTINAGYELVIGSRVLGKAEAGSLSPQQRFGNRLACYLIKKLWRHTYSDLGPFRAITAPALRRLAMNDRTFGWTVEMQIKALQHQLAVIDIPVSNLRRIGRSKISGTLKGTISAGVGILSMIAKLYYYEKRSLKLGASQPHTSHHALQEISSHSVSKNTPDLY